MPQSWPLSRQQILDSSGRPLLVPSVQFFVAGTTTPLGAFEDATLTIPLKQPLKPDGFGRFPRVFLPDGLYSELMLGPYDDLLWFDEGLGGASAETGGGDTPSAPSGSSSSFTTGDVKWRLDGGLQTDWVRMNGRTIGAAGSGASERANADTRALYRYLWLSFTDDIALVIGGRGLTWEDDFNAGRPITIPSMRGLVQAGLDTMGSEPANVLEKSVTLNLTAGSAQAVASDASQLAIEMLVTADGVTPGTRIVDIAGNTITMSAPATSAANGQVSARCGLIDARKPGSAGGDSVRPIFPKNLPKEMPGGSGTYDPPAFTVNNYAELVQINAGNGGIVQQFPGVWRAVNGNTIDQAPASLPVAISNPNGGVPVSTLQALRVGTFFMKL